MKDIDEDDAYHVYIPRPYIIGKNNKKNEGGISRARVNPVSWITNPASHTPVSKCISYFKRGCLVILFQLYNRPQIY